MKRLLTITLAVVGLTACNPQTLNSINPTSRVADSGQSDVEPAACDPAEPNGACPRPIEPEPCVPTTVNGEDGCVVPASTEPCRLNGDVCSPPTQPPPCPLEDRINGECPID